MVQKIPPVAFNSQLKQISSISGANSAIGLVNSAVTAWIMLQGFMGNLQDFALLWEIYKKHGHYSCNITLIVSWE